MPVTQKRARKVAKRPSTRSMKRPAKTRTMSAAHKKALAEGRSMSLAVDRYLAAVNMPKRRGRKVSKAALQQRLANARGLAKTATGLDRVLAAQDIRDLETKIAQFDSTTGADVKTLEAAFVKVAKKFGENRGIGYGAWRDAGVSAQVLQRAGIARNARLITIRALLGEADAALHVLDLVEGALLAWDPRCGMAVLRNSPRSPSSSRRPILLRFV